MKMKAIEVIRELDIPTVLVPTISKGDNSDELGDLINFGVELPAVLEHRDPADGAHRRRRRRLPRDAGRSPPHDARGPRADRAAAPAGSRSSTSIPVPCSHPSCYTATYLFRMNDGRYVPLPEFVDVRQYLDAMANQAIIRTDDQLERMILDSITNLWSATKVGEDYAT